MKEAIRMVPESIYDPDLRSREGGSSALRRIKEEWGTPRWFLELNIRKCFHNIDRHRLIPIFKEEIDDPKFFYSIQKVLSAGRNEKGPVPHSVLLSALPGNIYLHKLDQEIGRIRQKYEIPIVQRIRSAIEGEEGSALHRATDKRIQRKAAFHSLSWHTLPTPRRDQKCLFYFSFKPSSLLFAAFLIEAAGPKAGRERKNLAVRDRSLTPAIRDSKRPTYPAPPHYLEGLGEAARIRSEKGKQDPSHYLIRICYARYADDLLLGIVGAVELLIEIEKRIAHFLQYGLGVDAERLDRASSPRGRPSQTLPQGPPTPPDYLDRRQPTPPMKSTRPTDGGAYSLSNVPTPWWETERECGDLSARPHWGRGPDGTLLQGSLPIGTRRPLTSRSTSLTLRLFPHQTPYCLSNVMESTSLRRPLKGDLITLSRDERSKEARPEGDVTECSRQRRFIYSIPHHRRQARIEGSTTIAARSTVEFLGTVIREVPPKRTPIQFLRELEKRLRVKHRIHITACHLRSAINSKFRNLGQSIPVKELTKGMSKTGSLLDAVQLAESLSTEKFRSPQVSVLWETVKHIRQGRDSMVPSQRSGMRSSGRKAAGEGARFISSEFPIQIEAPIKKILRRLRDRGIISRRRPWPIHVARLTNVSDEDIVNWYAGIAISPLSYYRCRDNLYQVRTIVDHQIRWSAIFTLAHKQKSSARNIIPKYSKDSNIISGGKTLAEFPNSIELGKLGRK